jgi:arginase
VRVDVPPYDDVRDPETGLLNPQGITAVAGDVASAVDATLDAGRFPVLLGGDCSIVLGPLLALRRRGRYGLAFLGGHADFQHPSDEPNGEPASLDLAVATGRGPDLLTNLAGLRPLVRDEDVALVGYRARTNVLRAAAVHHAAWEVEGPDNPVAVRSGRWWPG